MTASAPRRGGLARRITRTAALLLLLDAAVAGLPAAAHEFWLAPSTYRAAAGDTVSVAAFVGTGFRGDQFPYVPAWTTAAALHGARTFDLRPAATPGQAEIARFIAADSGGEVVSYVSEFWPTALPAPQFDAYLALEGLDEPRAAREAARRAAPSRGASPAGEAPVRERFRRCVKTWIAGSESSRVLTPLGLPLEIVPLSAPGAAPSLTLEVLFGGRPLEGALARAWRAPFAADGSPRDATSRDSTGAVASARTDAAGVATLAIEAPGEWLVSVVHMVPSQSPADADWESYWASFTFAR